MDFAESSSTSLITITNVQHHHHPCLYTSNDIISSNYTKHTPANSWFLELNIDNVIPGTSLKKLKHYLHIVLWYVGECILFRKKQS